MNNKLISIVTGTVLSSLVAVTSYAWQPPSEACLDARVNLGIVMDVILQCKDYDPYGSWICTNPPRPVATQEKNDCLAVVRHECRGNELTEGTSCDFGDILPVKIQASSVSLPCPSANGRWILFNWNGDDLQSYEVITFNADFTTTPRSGEWSQNGCLFELRFQTDGTVYKGTMTPDGNSMSGNISTTEGEVEGRWTADIDMLAEPF